MSALSRLLQTLRGKPWAKRLGFALFAWLVFTFAFFLTFPSDALRDRVVREAEQRGLKVRLESVRLAFPLGLRFQEAYLILREPDPQAQKPAVAVHLPRLTLRPSLLGLLTGKKAIAFDARIWGGKLSGSAATSDEGARIEAHLRDVDLGESLLAAIGLQIEGKVDELRLVAEGAKLSSAQGEILLRSSDIVIRGGEVNHFSLPKVALGNLEGKIALADGSAQFESFQAKGEDVDARVEGSIRLADRFALSTLQTKLMFKPSEAWWSQNEMLRAGASMLRKESDGFHAIQVHGQLGKPRFRLN